MWVLMGVNGYSVLLRLRVMVRIGNFILLFYVCLCGFLWCIWVGVGIGCLV